MTNSNYTIIVAEDEPKILNNIVKKIDATCHSFSVIGSASNGQDALDLICKLKPDVLVTDIQMPKIDGLQLIREAKNLHPNIEIIIISGYNEFQYAQEAIKLGVNDYLLKPLEEKSLLSTFNSIKLKLDRASQNFERDIIFSNVNGMSNNISLPYPTAKCNYLFFLVCIGNLYNAISSLANNIYSDMWNKIHLEYILKDNLNSNLRWWIIDDKIPNQKFIIISSDLYTISPELLSHIFIDNISKLININVNICIAEKAINYTKLWEFAQAARKTLDRKLILGNSSIYYIDFDMQSFYIPLDATSNTQIGLLLQTNNKQTLDKEVSLLMNKWNALGYPQRFVENNLYALLRYCITQFTNLSEDEACKTESYLTDKICVCKNTQELANELLIIFDELMISKSKPTCSTEKTAEKIEKYIQDNFTEIISLEDISAKFNFSISYITKIFKKYKNDSVLNFLINLRINEAKRLIKEYPELALKSISKMVGYEDQHYFSRLFKTYSGYSPSEYRETIKP